MTRPDWKTLAGAGILTAALLVPAALADRGPAVESKTESPSSSSTATAARSSSPAPATAARSGGSGSSSTRAGSSRTSTRGTTSRAERGTSSRSERADRADASDWRGYDSYRRSTRPRHHRGSYHPRHRGHRYFYWGPWGYHHWGWGSHRYYPHHYPTTIRIYDERPGADWGALDLDVAPDDVEVFIDGGYVGTVDEFDGFPTYLWLEAGTYDVVLFREGYRTVYRQYTIRPGLVIDVNDSLTPGVSELPEDVMASDSTYYRDRRLQREAERQEDARREEEEARRWASQDRQPERSDELGRFGFRVWPADAAIYLDGHFIGTASELGQLSAGLLVAAGEHEIEIVRPGYETWVGVGDVRAGETFELEVDLEQD